MGLGGPSIPVDAGSTGLAPILSAVTGMSAALSYLLSHTASFPW
jgi:hypothetical protein